MAFSLANHCSSEIAELPEAGIAAAAPRPACQCQCLKQISAAAVFHMASPACQVAALSDVVALEFVADRVKAEDEPLSIQYSAWSKVTAAFVQIAGPASVVVGSPLQHFVRPC